MKFLIKKPIDINSIEKDSLVAVAYFIEKNPNLKTEVLQTNALLFQKATVIQIERQADRKRIAAFNKRQLQKVNGAKKELR